jgi:hypothetical protein
VSLTNDPNQTFCFKGKGGSICYYTPNDDIRPIAIGEIFLKLSSCYCFRVDSASMPSHFEPIQLAVGFPGGAERAIQTIQAANSDFIAIHVDSTNAFNEADRCMILQSIYADANLSHVWRLFNFFYDSPSSLLVRDRGTVVADIPSLQGVKQGCVFGSLGFAHLFQPIYEAAIRDCPNVTARAIMDDICFAGPPAEVFRAFPAFRALAATRSVQVNMSKTHVQQPRGPASQLTVALAARAGISIVYGNHSYLGAVVGVDDEDASAWLSAKLSSFSPLTAAIQNPSFPSALAFQLAKVNRNPSCVYLIRSLPLRVSRGPTVAFHAALINALSSRLHLPSHLPPSAAITFSQPGANGGLGLRDMALIIPAPKWASEAAIAPDICQFSSIDGPHLPCVLDRAVAHSAMAVAGIPLAPVDAPALDLAALDEDSKQGFGGFLTLPANADGISTYYQSRHKLPTLQRALSRQLEDCLLRSFLSSDA